MKPAPFTLHRPQTLDEALSLLAQFADEGGLVLAGGQSLVPMMALRVAYPPHLVDINGIAELARLDVGTEHLTIGATVRHARFHRPVEPGPLGHLMATISRHIAHYPIRMRGTFCGSVAHADPASEWCLVTATLDGRIRLASAQDSRVVTADAFFDGAMTTTREPEEMIASVDLPLLSAQTRCGFYEFNRRAGDFALGMAIAAFELHEGRMSNVRIGVGGIEEMPRRMTQAQESLEGRQATPEAFAEAGAAAAEAVDPMEDAATTADYRRDLCAVVVRRALERAFADTQRQVTQDQD